jgi:MT0933-like antitoxin protein
MPKIRNLAALAAAVEAGRRYARNNPDKAGKYVDQAAAFLDKQTKGKYHGQIDGVVSKVKNVAGLPQTSPSAQGFEANAGYGRHEGYGRSAASPSTTATQGPSSRTTSTTPPVTPTTTSTSPGSPSATVPPTTATVDPERTGERHFPGSKDV